MEKRGNRAATAAGMLVLALTGGCGTLGKDQCMNADWRQIGYADGTQGQPGNRIQEHAKSCASYGVRPDLDAYLKGREEGLVSFCQPVNGYNLGRTGGGDHTGDCPPDLKAAFQQQYQLGRQVFPFEQGVGALRARIASDQDEVHRIDSRIDRLRKDLRRTERDPRRHKALLSEYNDLLERRDRIGRDRGYLERDLAQAERALADKLREIGK